MGKRKPPAHAWKERELHDWNAHTFLAFLRDRHAEIFGIKYVPANIRMELGMIRRMIDEYGPEVTLRFIEKCFEWYKLHGKRPAINFSYMNSHYMRPKILPIVLNELAKKTKHAETKRSAREASDSEWDSLF